MRKLVLKVICYNWNEEYGQKWIEKRYLIYDDLTLDYYLINDIKNQEYHLDITQKQYDSLMRNINYASKRKKPVEGSSGHGYEMIWCDNDEVIWQSRLGYIDGDINLERIARLLYKIIYDGI